MSRVEAPALPARRRPRRLRLRLGKILRQLVLAVAGLTALYPIVFMASTAFKDRAQYLENQYDLPWPLYFGNFSAALRGGTFFLWFKNSVILTTGSVVLCTASALPSPPSRWLACGSAAVTCSSP